MTVVPENARNEKYKRKLTKHAEAKTCPFCSEDLDMELLGFNADWKLIANENPLEHTAGHWLLIPKRHVESVTELTKFEWRSFQQMFAFFHQMIGRPAGGVGYWRDGDKRLSGGTVQHLHFQYAVPDGDMIVEFKKRGK